VKRNTVELHLVNVIDDIDHTKYTTEWQVMVWDHNGRNESKDLFYDFHQKEDAKDARHYLEGVCPCPVFQNHMTTRGRYWGTRVKDLPLTSYTEF
jgi:hypothetical protein